MSRFDTRLSKEQKKLFEYASTLGGFRSLTEFVIYSAQQHANNIIEKHRTILASHRDQEIFFDALMIPPKANIALKKAAKKFEKATSKNNR